ncbi:hypothetical protein FAI40_04555 [Acetobacteraceae bacterium]|nr:hypothetical protein FAI40_04555 [Acetobacteraceae bacterium]
MPRLPLFFAVVLGLSLFPVMGQSAEPKMVDCKPLDQTDFYLCKKEKVQKKALFVPPNTTPVATIKDGWRFKTDPVNGDWPETPRLHFNSHRVSIFFWVVPGALDGRKIKDHSYEPFKIRVLPRLEIGQEYFPCFSGAVTLWFENGQSFVVDDIKTDDGKDGFDKACIGGQENIMLTHVADNFPYAERRDRQHAFAELVSKHRIVAVSSGKRSILLDYPADDPAIQKFQEMMRPEGSMYYTLKYNHENLLKMKQEGKVP